jgi:chorismate dehydratase
MNKIKISAVSYLNTKPMLFGLVKSELNEQIELKLDIPSVCADKLMRGEADLALVPVAIIPKLNNPKIVSDFCIGTVGAVKTVCIYSQVPIEEMTHLYLDFHSRTSVELAQVLMKEYWEVSPTLLKAKEGFEEKITGTTGAVVIGDRTMGLDDKFPYIYDLGEHWMKFTGLPFVFAAWVANRELPDEFLRKFNTALKNGVAAIPELMLLLPEKENFDLEEYFTHHISYNLDDKKREALALFLQKMKDKNRRLEMV